MSASSVTKAERKRGAGRGAAAQPVISRRHRNLLLAAAVSTALLVTLGAVVCATESGEACPDWPGCYGRAIPPPQIHAIIEYTHRLVALITTPLIVASAYLGWRKARSSRLIKWLPTIAVFFTLAVVVFGALTVLRGLPRGVAALDLGFALIVLMLMTAAATVATAKHAAPETPERLSAVSPLARLSAATALGVYATYVAGILVAGPGSLTRCLSWPIWRVLPFDLPGWPQAIRLVLSLTAALLLLALVRQASSGRSASTIRAPALLLLGAFLLEMAVGVVMMIAGASPFLAVLYVAAAVAVWCMVIVIATRAALAATAVEQIPSIA